jgi:hypothetical protein
VLTRGRMTDREEGLRALSMAHCDSRGDNRVWRAATRKVRGTLLLLLCSLKERDLLPKQS